MCNLKHPVTNVPTGGPGGTPIGDDPLKTGTLPLGMEPTSTTMQPTKFSKLLRVALPIMQGGLDAAVANTSSPAATAAKSEQNRAQMLPLQQAELQERIRAQRATEGLEAARVKQIGETGQQRTIDRVIDGEVHTFQYNPKSGTYDTDLGPSGKMAERPDRPEIISSKQGMFSLDPNTKKMSQLTTPAPEIPERESPMIPGTMDAQPTPPQMPLEPISQERVEDAEMRATEPHPTAVTDSDEKGVSTTHFIDTNPRSKTYMKDVKGGKAAATRQPKPSKSQTPNKAEVETYAQEALMAATNDADKALLIVDGLKKMPPEIKASVRQRIREIKRPGEKKDIFQKYGINPNAAPQMPGQPGQ